MNWPYWNIGTIGGDLRGAVALAIALLVVELPVLGPFKAIKSTIGRVIATIKFNTTVYW